MYYGVTERNPLMSSCLLDYVIFFKVTYFRGFSFTHHANANCTVLSPLVQTTAVTVGHVALAFTKMKEVLPRSQQRMILLRRFRLLEKETFLQ